jgi:NADPH:quinone reductase-like Zn-dependent oxidoreductase
MPRVVAYRFGDPAQVLSFEPSACPVSGSSEIVVRMLASAINPSDLLTPEGAYRSRTPLPFVPGFEGVGVIEAVGPESTDLKVGQRVLPLGSAGGWQTFKAVPADWCVPVPEDVADEEAATAYINPLTAKLMLKSVALSPGACVGINAANSAIGRILLRTIRAAGAHAVAIVRSPGAKAALDGEPVSAIVIEGQRLPPLDFGFDAAGGESGVALASAISPRGVLLHYGLLSGVPLPADLAQQMPATTVRPFWLRSWVHAATSAERRSAMSEVFNDIRAGLAQTHVEARYPLRLFAAALAHNARGARRGKVLVEP